MSGATLFLLILCAGVGSQWLAWRANLPAIVVLIAAGIILGPVTGVIDLQQMSSKDFNEIVGLGVAIILFSGGMELKLEEYRRIGQGIKRLTILGPPIAWGLGCLAAHYIGGMDWPVSFVLAAILVVTGPTVVLPLLQQAKLNRETASLLRWEGIVNDPVGVLLAILTFQYLTLTSGGVEHIALGIGGAILAAILLGGGTAWLLSILFQRGFVPEYLKVPVLLSAVLAVYWASNEIQAEAGLLSVTLMGLVIGNANIAERDWLQRFKDDLSTILLSILFIVIASRLKLTQLQMIDWRIILFVIALMFIVRPLTIFLASLGSRIRKKDRYLISWIAPRGIVAAATAGLFGSVLSDYGYQDADKLLPVIFLVIIVTVIAHGFTLRWLAGKLGLTVQGEGARGILIVGSSPWSRAFARALKRLNIDVLMVDGSYRNLRAARMENIDVYPGELLSEHAEYSLEIQQYGYLLCASDNDYYNALVCKTEGAAFGRHLSLQLPTYQEAQMETKRLPLQQRGYFAFNNQANFEFLHEKLTENWTIQTTPLTETFPLEKLKERICQSGGEWIFLGGVSPSGELRLYSEEQPFTPGPGWIVLHFSPKAAPGAPEGVCNVE